MTCIIVTVRLILTIVCVLCVDSSLFLCAKMLKKFFSRRKYADMLIVVDASIESVFGYLQMITGFFATSAYGSDIVVCIKLKLICTMVSIMKIGGGERAAPQ